MNNKTLILATLIFSTISFFIGKNLSNTNKNINNKNQYTGISNDEKQKNKIKKIQNNSIRLTRKARQKTIKKDIHFFNKKYQMTNRYNDLKKYFPENEHGEDLLKMTTLIEFHEMAGSLVSTYIDEKMEKMISMPYKTMNNLQEIFNNLPNKYANEKQYLLQFAQKLEVDQESKINFFLNEAKRPLASSTSEEDKLTAIHNSAFAFKGLAKTLNYNKQQMEVYLRESIESLDSDTDSKKALIHSYGRYDSKTADRLKREYIK